MPDQEAVFRHLVTVYPTWRTIVGLPADTCIAATRIGNEVLGYFGIPSVPLPVAVAVQNPKLAQLVAAGAILENPKQIEELGGYSIGVDPDQPPTRIGERKGWNCHLVLWAPDHRMLVDLSLDQYDRPKRDITVGTVGLRLPEEVAEGFLSGANWLPVVRSNGVRVLYLHRADQVGYRTAPDWKRGRYRKAIGTLIRLIRDRLDADEAQTQETPTP